MNNELPQPVRKALSRQEAAVHPSPDLLTAFAEHTLAAKERQGVSHHLAQCSECREVVFLASGAAEESTSVIKQVPGRRWFRLVWAAPALAAIVMVAAVILERDSLLRRSSAPLTIASNQSTPAERNFPAPAAPAAKASESAPKSETAFVAPKPAQRRATAPRTAELAISTALAKSNAKALPSAATAHDSFAAPSPSTRPTEQTATEALASALAGATASNAVTFPKQSSFAANQADQEAQSTQAAKLLATPEVAKRSLGAAGQWRISADGHLERSMSAHTWTRVMAEAPTTFRTVAVIGQDVWAGGSGGALFHSRDGGQHWSRVALTSAGVAESSAVVSILFDDPQHGAVGTADGTHWLTTDGGVSWEKQ